MKKSIILLLLGAALTGTLITVSSTTSHADQQRQHSTIMLRYDAVNRPVYDANGQLLYDTEDDFVITMVSSSANAPEIPLGTRYAVANAFLRDAGYEQVETIPYRTEKWIDGRRYVKPTEK